MSYKIKGKVSAQKISNFTANQCSISYTLIPNSEYSLKQGNNNIACFVGSDDNKQTANTLLYKKEITINNLLISQLNANVIGKTVELEFEVTETQKAAEGEAETSEFKIKSDLGEEGELAISTSWKLQSITIFE